MDIAEQLRTWFLANKRNLPWRHFSTPYRVWISEVMLQQTQASRVVLFFERWMERFPTIVALASASEEEVLKLWEGLGYYSRARALLHAARFLVEHHKGKLPDQADQLHAIKGLGPYTVGAIQAFGFHKKAAAVDANVIRLLARLFEIRVDISKASTKNEIWQRAEALLPEKEPWVVAEAMIELGALICTPKNPNCMACPLQMGCKSVASGTETEIPVNSKKIQYELLFREVMVCFHNDHVLVKRGEKNKIMQGLYEFPYVECEKGGLTPRKVAEQFSYPVNFVEKLKEVKQSFTRYRATLYPKIFTTHARHEVANCEWKSLEQADQLAFSSGHRRILDTVLQQSLHSVTR
ncbi:MAG TPA: A/G-specific adenine glycosylase [Chlamydiales bacterium]|nr:A/G-specific adenine glycosylase [Chlamydiales bacterium]